MKTLLLLPFRGLLWLILGLLCSSVWLLIAALFTTSYWLPPTLSWLWEMKTDFPCKIESAKIDWFGGKICLKNVTLYNPTSFLSSDMASFSKIECRFDWLSLSKQTLHIDELNFFGTKLASIEQSENHNWAMLNRHLNTHEKQPTKGVWVENLRFTFDGMVAHHSYRGTSTVSVTKRTRSFEFSNLCINVPKDVRKNLNQPCTLQTVYGECGRLLVNN